MSRYVHEATFRTAIGDIEFDENGDMRRSPYAPYVWRDGVGVPLE
jgi:hypothetical protein